MRNRVDLDDLAVGDGESQDRKGSSAYGDHYPRGAVHQRRMQLCMGKSTYKCLLGNSCCAACDLRSCWSSAAKISAQYDVGIQHRDEGFEIAATCCSEECIDDLALPDKIMIRSGYLDALDTSPRPAGELSSCWSRSIDHGSDLRKRHP